MDSLLQTHVTPQGVTYSPGLTPQGVTEKSAARFNGDSDEDLRGGWDRAGAGAGNLCSGWRTSRLAQDCQ
jgi:hypothetical protein